MTDLPSTRSGNGPRSRDDADLVKLNHAVYATRDGQYEVRTRSATTADRDWWVMRHPLGDDDPARVRLFGPFKNLAGAAGFVRRAAAREGG
jgi:hypothetical protein